MSALHDIENVDFMACTSSLCESATLIRAGWFTISILLAGLAAGCFDAGPLLPKATAPSASNDSERATGGLIREPFRIEITGNKYHWDVRYPAVDERCATGCEVESARMIHVPLDTEIVFVLKSLDYVYVLSLPEFEQKEIAVPSLEFQMGFHPRVAGEFALLGDEMCGDPHPELKGHLVVEPQAQFLAWLKR